MADTALNSNRKVEAADPSLAAESLGKTAVQHNAQDVLVLDVSATASWTDRFLIATATSTAHMRGLERFLDEKAQELGLSRLSRATRADEDEWLLLDFGSIIVHLMTASARSFYELEKLWFEAPRKEISQEA